METPLYVCPMHVIGTAGHVDHGKSTLVQALTGIDPDRFAEEKRRGLTIDLGFAWFTLPSGNEIGMVDVPGHERFIANMLAGAGGISVCLFVVAANEGWKPQSAEHLAIVDILGVSHGVVALTKSDTVDADQVASVSAEVEEHLAGTSLEGARVMPCSAITGDGMTELIAELDRVVSGAPAALDLGKPRLWVDRVFTITGAGTVVTGTLAGGSFAANDEVEISPEGRRARIRKIQSHKKEVASIAPENRAALNLAGLERQGARRGDAIVRSGQWQPTARVDASVRVLPRSVTDIDHEITEKGSHLLYVGSAEMPVRIKLLDRDRLQPGEDGLAQLYLRDPLPLTRGDRFVLRDAGRVETFGGGVVLDPLPSTARRGDTARIESLQVLAASSPEEAAAHLVSSEGDLAVHDVLLRAGVDALPEGIVVLGGRAVSQARLGSLLERLRAVLDEHHRQNPLEKGMAREALRAAVDVDADAFDALLGRAEGVVVEKAVVRSASHLVALDPVQERARAEILYQLTEGGYSPPLTKDLRADPTLLRALTDSGDIVKVGDFYLAARHALAARRAVRDFIEVNGPVTVAQIRDVLGTSRKYAVPLCEWLDDTGATIRRADLRHLGPTP